MYMSIIKIHKPTQMSKHNSVAVEFAINAINELYEAALLQNRRTPKGALAYPFRRFLIRCQLFRSANAQMISTALSRPTAPLSSVR